MSQDMNHQIDHGHLCWRSWITSWQSVLVAAEMPKLLPSPTYPYIAFIPFIFLTTSTCLSLSSLSPLSHSVFICYHEQARCGTMSMVVTESFKEIKAKVFSFPCILIG
jgi:hypothetical protein